jgi:hypothetical protein
MLGEKVLEEKGKVVSKRVIETSPQPKIEITFEASGSIFGLEHRTIGTYWSVMQPNGQMYGEGNGIVMTKEGVGTWKEAVLVNLMKKAELLTAVRFTFNQASSVCFA